MRGKLGPMVDVDTAYDCGTTVLAANLNAAMARNPAAREAYARIYGVAWAPTGNGVEINDSASTTANTVR